MSLTDSLLRLFQVDSQVRGLRNRLDAANRYYAAQSGLVDSITNKHEELQSRRRQVQATVANLETEVKAIDERLEKLRDELNTSVTNKQYTAVLNELNVVKENRGAIEDRILQYMEQIEELDDEITATLEQIEERKKVREIAEAELTQRKADIGERLAELEAEREQAAAEVPGTQLAVFDQIASQYDGEAMAPIEEVDRRHREYACGACNMHMPFEHVLVLMGGSETLVCCTACDRILYLQEEVRGALAKK